MGRRLRPDQLHALGRKYGLDLPVGQPETDHLTMVVTAQHQPRHACARWHPFQGRWGEPTHCVTCALVCASVIQWRLALPTRNSHCPMCGERMT